MKGVNIAEQGHLVNILPPIDINGAGATSDYFSLKEYQYVDIIIQLGVTGAASTVTVFEADDVTPSNETAIAFKYRAEDTAAGDTLGALTTATVAGFATSTNDNIFYVIRIDASQLTQGYPYVAIKMSDPSAATVVSAIAILSGARYQQNVTPTAIL